LKYRAEIDGLRTLAVVPVILFHAGFELFSGGFVGVDVFLVISGYLITTILIEDIEAKRFSIVNFYERRARRILPALFFVMLVCIPFAWMWMPPNQMKEFSLSLVAVSLFASNMFFWRQTGYFEADAEEKPLLHTWSLAVEEQYYVLFPIFLFLAWNFGKNRVFWMIVVIAAISLLLSEWGWRNKADANFYLAPTRAWELFAGSIAAFIVQKNGVQKNNVFALLGLAAIIFSIFAYDESTPFPSVYALVPVLGAVLVVLYAEKETVAAQLLSTKAFVGIGVISYSAYLWHQPLFAFARLRLIEEPSKALMLSLSMISISLAFLSWRYVEKPFRLTETISFKRLALFAIAGFAFFVVTGLSGHWFSKHFEDYYVSHRLSPEQASLYEIFEAEVNYDMYDYQRSYSDCHHWQRTFDSSLVDRVKTCNDKHDKVILVIGGSHAMNLYNVLSEALTNDAVIGVSQGYCRLSEWKHYCDPSQLFNFISQHSGLFDKVIYHQNGEVVLNNNYTLSTLQENLVRLESILKDKLMFWGPWVEGRTRFTNVVTGKASNIPSRLVMKFDELDVTLAGFSQNNNINYFSLFTLFSSYQVKLVEGDCLLYRDKNHLSRCAETLFAEKFTSEFSREIAR
jgi:peptidoglycan/LPS O-acetylase OafA/YrhL